MTEKQKDVLAGVGGRLDAHRTRLGGGPANVDFAVDLAMGSAVLNTLVLFIDRGKVPEVLQNAIARNLDAVERRMVITADQRERFGARSGGGSHA